MSISRRAPSRTTAATERNMSKPIPPWKSIGNEVLPLRNRRAREATVDSAGSCQAQRILPGQTTMANVIITGSSSAPDRNWDGREIRYLLSEPVDVLVNNAGV